MENQKIITRKDGKQSIGVLRFIRRYHEAWQCQVEGCVGLAGSCYADEANRAFDLCPPHEQEFTPKVVEATTA